LIDNSDPANVENAVEVLALAMAEALTNSGSPEKILVVSLHYIQYLQNRQIFNAFPFSRLTRVFWPWTPSNKLA